MKPIKKKMEKKVIVGKGLKVKRGEETKMRKEPGGSNVGDYKAVKKSSFAGPAGGAPKGSYPINTEARAKSALSYAHNAPSPEGIKARVYSKYPGLKKRRDERAGK